MRQLFLPKSILSINKVVQSRLDDYSVLVLTKYAYISSEVLVENFPKYEANFLTNVPIKLKKILESLSGSLSNTPEVNDVKTTYPCVGQVIALGKEVRSVRVGDTVVCAADLNQIEVARVAEHLVVKLENNEIIKTASIIPFGAHSLHILRKSKAQLGEWVCIVGLDIVGLLCVQLAKKIGCNVIAIDNRKEHLQLAEQFNSDVGLHLVDDNIEKEVQLATEHHGVDVTIIAQLKKEFSITRAIEITRKKGRVVFSGNIVSNSTAYTKKEISLESVCSYGPGSCEGTRGLDYPYSYVRWTAKRNMKAFLDLLESKTIIIDPFVTNEIPAGRVNKINDQLNKPGNFGCIVKFEVKKTKRSQSKSTSTGEKKFIPAVKDVIQVGFLGVRCLENSSVMVEIKKMRGFKLNTVVDGDIVSGKRSSGYEKVLDEKILYDEGRADLIVIGSPHKMHWQQTEQALKQGKPVLVVNPLVTDFSQLKDFKDFLSKNTNAPLIIDYHREFSPFIQKIKTVVAKRRTPIMISYRMNNPSISKEQLFQSFGAGRVIGQAAHIIDLFCFLTNSQPRSVSVESLQASRTDIFPTDNFSAHITFYDGSVCTLLFTTLGHDEVGTERMEIFYDRKAIVMDDWISLYGFGLPSWFNETVTKPDKGEYAFLSHIQHELKKESSTLSIDYKRLENVSELTLIIDQLACEGGGASNFG